MHKEGEQPHSVIVRLALSSFCCAYLTDFSVNEICIVCCEHVNMRQSLLYVFRRKCRGWIAEIANIIEFMDTKLKGLEQRACSKR